VALRCVRSTNLENEEAKARYRAVKIQPQWVVTPGKQVVTVGCDVVVLVFIFTGLTSSLLLWPFKIEISVTSVTEVYHHWIMLRFVSDMTGLIVSPETVFTVNVYSCLPCCSSLPRQNVNVDESLQCVIA
jgi:hypothetical protein